MARRSTLSDVPPAWRPGGEVYRALYGDPVPPNPMSRIGSALVAVGLWGVTLYIMGVPQLAWWLIGWAGSR